MTIEEAITECGNIADLCEDQAKKCDLTDSYESAVAGRQGECADKYRQIAEWLKELKQLREQTRWIPVSEESPKKSGKYWCTFGGTNLTGTDYYTTESDAKELFDDPEEYAGWGSQNVVAWMPEPQPYREVENDEMDAEFDLEDGDTMPEHMDLEHRGVRIDFHCKQQQPCEDCVSRQAVDRLVWEYLKKGTDENIAFYEHFLDLPSVTPQEPRKGHWIDTNYYHYYNDGDIETTELRCSCCNEEVEWDIVLSHKPYYCENCGADMRGGEE